MNKLNLVLKSSVSAPNHITLYYLLWKQKFIDNFQINSLTNKPTDQPHIEAAEVIGGS